MAFKKLEILNFSIKNSNHFHDGFLDSVILTLTLAGLSVTIMPER